MDTNTSILLLIADLNAQVRGCQEQMNQMEHEHEHEVNGLREENAQLRAALEAASE